MRAISLWQPWATLWLLSDPDEKVFETRHWGTSFRGELLVHAAKTRNREVCDALDSPELAEALARHGMVPRQLPFGALIGKVYLAQSALMAYLPVPSERERQWGYWLPQRYGWKRGPRPAIFDRAIPYRGAQGFFDVPNEVFGAQPAQGVLL